MTKRRYSNEQFKVVDRWAREMGYKNRFGVLRLLGEWSWTFKDVLGDWFEKHKGT